MIFKLIILLLITSLIFSLFKLFSNIYNKFGNIINSEDCYNSPLANNIESLQSCIRTANILNKKINAQYQGLPANRGLTYPGEAEAGSFGNPNILN